jgi:hypothetical protein
MTAYTHARASANRAAHSKSLTIVTRAGFIGYGLLHVLVAWLALQIAVGRAPAEGDQSGAFGLLARSGAGKVALIMIVVGLIAMTLWQVFTAAMGHRDKQGGRRIAERIASACRAVVYAGLAWSAGKIVTGSGNSAAANQQKATAGALSSGGGRALVIVVAIVVLAVGIGLAVYGVTGKFEENLNTAEMGPSVRRAARWLGTSGYAAKGAAYAIVGLLLGWAAISFDPNKSRGLDSALRTLAGQPYGGVLLAIVAVGFAAFGGFCVVQARYRKV